MSILTIADLKRSGFAALDAALATGEPVQLMKRNRPGAVVLRPQDYERLVAARNGSGLRSPSALQMLLQADADPSERTLPLDADAMAARLAELNAGWSER